MEYRKEIKMKEFSIYCKNKKEADKVLKKLEEQGYLWSDGEKPTQWYPRPPYHNTNKIYIESHGNHIITWDDGNVMETISATEFLGEGKIIIYANGNQVIAKYANTKKEAIAKCHPDDEFDFSIGARLAFDRLMGTSEPIAEKPKYYNGKIICIKSCSTLTTKGKIYEIKNGKFTYDDGSKENIQLESIDDINMIFASKFIELVE